MKKKILKRVFFLLNNIIPKNRKRIIFHSYPDYSDNSKAISDYLKSNKYNDKYNIVWLVSNLHNIKAEDNIEFLKIHSLKSYWFYLRSKYVFHTHGLFYNTFSKTQMVICLWHGMPLKKILNLDPRFKRDATDFHFDYSIATSAKYKKIMADCFGCNEDKILLTGMPRNDLLFDSNQSLNKLGINKSNYEKIIFWLPTFRKNSDKEFGIEGNNYELGLPIIDQNNLNSLNEFLSKNNVFLIIKLHPLQVLKKNCKLNTSNIIFLENDRLQHLSINLYSLLSESDVLLTDYSSVYIDYLAVNRPIGFVYDDIKKYSKDRGFIFEDIETYMPGPKINTYIELVSFIKNIAESKDDFVEQRVTLSNELNIFHDNRNCERLVGFLNL